MYSIKVGKYSISLTNPDKVLFPNDDITKRDIVSYYANIGNVMLPHVKNRLISMLRYPNGIEGEGFYQKDAPAYFPHWIKRYPIKNNEGKIVKYIVLDKAATLAYLASQACITPHVWLSRISNIDYPDRLIFDLDPSGKTFDFNLVRKTAFIFRDLLEEVGLVPFIMTTGSRGMHVVVPLRAKQDFDFVRNFARTLCEYVAAQAPTKLTTELRKTKRGKRIFLDYLRNYAGATAVAPYSIRPRDTAPVATPISWKEVGDARLQSTRYNYKTIFKYVDKYGDIWHDINKYASSLILPHKRLNAIIENQEFLVKL